LDRTNWRVFALAFGAGFVAALHIGKLPPALATIREDLGAGLVLAGWIASTISTVGTLLGLIAGGVADRIGPRRSLLAGLVALTCGSLVGGLAPGPAAMLAARLIEGIGFASVTVSGGILIARAAAPADRRRALAAWGAYMPLGFATMLLVSALALEGFGWRAVWLLAAGLTAAWALAVAVGLGPGDGGEGRRDATVSVLQSLRVNMGRTGALLIAACYALYAAQHIGVSVQK
jgi:Arabinose efflux permease